MGFTNIKSSFCISTSMALSCKRIIVCICLYSVVPTETKRHKVAFIHKWYIMCRMPSAENRELHVIVAVFVYCVHCAHHFIHLLNVGNWSGNHLAHPHIIYLKEVRHQGDGNMCRMKKGLFVSNESFIRKASGWHDGVFFSLLYSHSINFTFIGICWMMNILMLFCFFWFCLHRIEHQYEWTLNIVSSFIWCTY